MNSSSSTPYHTPSGQHHLTTVSATLSRQLSGGGGHVTSSGGHMTAGLRHRNVGNFSPAHASTGGNELLLRATSKRETSMRDQLFGKVRVFTTFIAFSVGRILFYCYVYTQAFYRIYSNRTNAGEKKTINFRLIFW